MSTTDESRVAPAAATPLAVADPGPLGLAGFALTTFLLSAANAGWTRGVTALNSNEWLPYALAYGGVAQLLAGMWEFRNRNVFGATAFATYGSFWIGLWFYVRYIAAIPGENVANDLGWILVGFAIFTFYMVILSLETNPVLFGVFLFLEIALIVLAIGRFADNSNLIKVGGYVGIVTAVLAWYASAAGIANGMGGRLSVPVGRPILGPRGG